MMLIQLIPSFDIGYRQRVCLLYSKKFLFDILFVLGKLHYGECVYVSYMLVVKVYPQSWVFELVRDTSGVI